MKKFALLALALAAAPLALAPVAAQAETVTYVAPPAPATGMAPPFSTAVMAGDTLYVSGTLDAGAPTAEEAAKKVLDNVKKSVEAGGLTMDDLVFVQIFAADLGDYAAFNQVYRTYFTGPMPARAFIGAGSLLANSRFEIMGIAVKKTK